ncbi:MAG: signal peptidase I [Woeseiaceae bacterium]
MVPDWVNLPLLFVVLTFVSGVVVAVEKFYWRERRLAANPSADSVPGIVDFSQAFFPILAFILILRSFIFEPYRIPSESMLPTLLIGDFVVVSKYSYGFRLPVTNTLIKSTGLPERGDVAVFRKPGEPNINFIKRVVGVPGDKIVYRDHVLTVNGQPVALSPVGEFRNEQNRGLLFDERFGERDHQILIQSTRSGEFSYTVGEGCYFMMGDNRDRSHDSRFSDIGCIPEENLVGRATRIWMSWRWLEMPRWSRIGNKIE